MREPARFKLLVAIAFCFQEAVETDGGTHQFENWAKRCREDEECAIATLDALYNNLRKQVMGTTAAQEVWEMSASGSTDQTLEG